MLLRVTNPPLYVAAGIVGNLTAKVLIHFFTEQAASWSGSSPIYCGGSPMGLLSLLCEPSAPTKSLGIIWFNPSKGKDATVNVWLVFLLKLTSGHTKIPSLLDQAKPHVTLGPQSTEYSQFTGYFRACHTHESTDGTLSRLSKRFSGHSDVHHTVGQTLTQNNQDTNCPMWQRWCRGDTAEISIWGGEGAVDPEVWHT